LRALSLVNHAPGFFPAGSTAELLLQGTLSESRSTHLANGIDQVGHLAAGKVHAPGSARTLTAYGLNTPGPNPRPDSCGAYLELLSNLRHGQEHVVTVMDLANCVCRFHGAIEALSLRESKTFLLSRVA
jgi:hypothetical protein